MNLQKSILAGGECPPYGHSAGCFRRKLSQLFLNQRPEEEKKIDSINAL